MLGFRRYGSEAADTVSVPFEAKMKSIIKDEIHYQSHPIPPSQVSLSPIPPFVKLKTFDSEKAKYQVLFRAFVAEIKCLPSFLLSS